MKKANPNGKTKKEMNQDDPKGPKPQFGVPAGGPFWHPKRHQNRPENDPKSTPKIKRQKKRSKTILVPSWGDLGPSWAAILGEKTSKTIGKRNVS